MKHIFIYLACIITQLTACGDKTDSVNNIEEVLSSTKANITSVTVSGNEDNYTFNIGIESPDLGCNQYANWWEIISEDGKLHYRRILGHSHVNEQPFTRPGGPVKITKDQIVYIRAHMNTNGNGDVVFKGSVSLGFNKQTLDTGFASELETIEPLPDGCAF